jgi:putative tricarboxylic transport membrane protein
MLRMSLSTDLLTGLLFFALGGCAIVYGWHYPTGTAARMGPGYYPFVVSSGLLLLGAILIIRSFFVASETIGSIALRPLFFVLLGTLAFGLLVERTGFVVASFVVVFAARLADRDFRLLEVTLLATFLVAFVAALFWLGLSLPLKPFVF